MGAGKWVIIGSSAGIVLILIVLAWILRRRLFKWNIVARRKDVSSRGVLPEESGSMRFSIREVYVATNNLHDSNLIGKGTAGKVYRGILSNKQQVAVKHIVDGGHMETFLREIRNHSRIRHPNLVALLGFCERRDECFLVYELCPHGNLSEWLFGKDKALSWIQRIQIAVDCARGLWFLHTYPEGCIVHRDIKVDLPPFSPTYMSSIIKPTRLNFSVLQPTNILLGANFEGKLSDFGLSKAIDLDKSHASSEVRGTFGYVDPEYESNRQVNSSGDVYSFGIVLLQIISGKRVINMNMQAPMPLNKMAKSLTKSGSIVEFVDRKLEGEYSSEAFDSVLNLGLSCTAAKQQRPSMAEVVLTLEEALQVSKIAKASTPQATPERPPYMR
ncbi:probable receptor-like protein kinase At1g30570 isoform X1 [Diospyros lotus]|uniref:probable receptor-like protein kinase At1g30570 isoform X1 n=1 Tax=Diospyros lotus TaxID=55363 RepID=UPI002250BD2D|nr:probable receptor-like protein kinase At1g30570 isoform X1 [Diospyros lotus]